MPLRELPDTSWMSRASCRGAVELMFPPDDADKAELMAHRARARVLCENCPVQAECLRWALTEQDPLVGCVVAGLTQGQLRRARKESADILRANRVPKCGSDAAYEKHVELGEECSICLDAHARRNARYAPVA
jgi:hypothetical protein